MTEGGLPPSHAGSVVLDVGGDVGALVVHTRSELAGAEIEISSKDAGGRRTHTEVRERRLGDRSVFAAVFPSLPAGVYVLWDSEDRPAASATVLGGDVAEVEWRSPGGDDGPGVPDHPRDLRSPTTREPAVPDGSAGSIANQPMNRSRT